ncbi:MAG: glycosyltransferase family 9 protein [Candidatus Cloacimonadaceae bacterium]|nr:glycosyltransferase family 9 protein [Candidatus Cloacimonadota bacterium]MDY0126654.1 glycosyltransferase family 9 protein [Candidatus Cloacimonadaceae bacterium]MCB5255548.1 glycosyltransferase family 9 protein [Candidatus Cloacimonadota bacterium]MCK9177376.1 glycosyltransferase family 9 protein [Candidatus Cloacimonadota bacterium]MCK9241815.1 glycosyltransferase family 9 protein [Candidatus Cloacimonadota bacterium]
MNILILRLSSLGDIVLTQPVCAWLRERYPEARIDYMVKEQYLELIPLMGCALNPLSYQKSLKAHRELKKENYDLVIDLHAKLSTWLIRNAAQGRKSAVYNKERSKRQKIVRGNRQLSICSTVILYKSALDKVFDQVNLQSPRLYPPADIALLALEAAPSKRILIFPGAKHNTKRYPSRYYKLLIDISPKPWQYIILGSPGEAALCAEIAKGNQALNMAGKYSFTQILALMQSADWVLSSDSGPMHLAAALQRPQIAIFGATHPRLGFAPLNPNARILAADISCQPCSLHGSESCPQQHFKCMHSIKAEQILQIMQGTEDCP